ncbi:hypothetical protein RUM44_010126 [Polyplax serrata]|uniref:Sodium/hydrogen exchanger n=1 Tax=Polyplax serrata TaxID=468196 RepID=A0ABR1AWF5_POLSC
MNFYRTDLSTHKPLLSRVCCPINRVFFAFSLMIIMGVILGTILFLSGVPEPENEVDKVVPDGAFTLPTFTPRLFFLILLPPVILESSYSLYDRSFADNLSTILVYAVIGTLINTFLVGPLLYVLSIGGLLGLIKLTMTETIVFAALISAVDPVAVLAIFQEHDVLNYFSKVGGGIVKAVSAVPFVIESITDAVTIVLYTTTVTFTEMKNIDGSQFGLAIVAFFTVSLGGLVIGIFFGLVTALITKTTQDVRVVEPLAVLGIAYLSYLAAELFHFSGIISIIGCGVVQAHYALKNISDNSRTTVTYFTKMISSTSDAIIFLFLGMVLVSKRHVWHTGFVLWTLLLCFLCRFIGVFCLSAFVNLYRVRKINFQEQFIMAYGGLRGAVAFSLVTMLDDDVVNSQPIFLTTTLIVILFTVFIQGGTIKWLVNLLRIKKSTAEEKTMNEEINDNARDIILIRFGIRIIRTMMAGIEEISGVRGDNYVRRKIEYIDEHYLKKIFLNTTKSNSLTRLYEKLAMTQHIAHLYGPVVLVEDKKADLLHDEYADTRKKLLRSFSARHPRNFTKRTDFFQGVQLRRRTMSDFNRPSPAQLQLNRSRASTEQLRKAFRDSAYNKFRERYDPNVINDMDEREMLRRRHETAQRITYQAALSQRHSIPLNSDEETSPDDDKLPSRKILPDTDGIDPETLEGIDVILDRARKRLARHNSNVEIFSDNQQTSKQEQEGNSMSTTPLIPSGRSNYYWPGKTSRGSRKGPRLIEARNELQGRILPAQRYQKPRLGRYLSEGNEPPAPATAPVPSKEEETPMEDPKKSSPPTEVTESKV